MFCFQSISWEHFRNVAVFLSLSSLLEFLLRRLFLFLRPVATSSGSTSLLPTIPLSLPNPTAFLKFPNPHPFRKLIPPLSSRSPPSCLAGSRSVFLSPLLPCLPASLFLPVYLSSASCTLLTPCLTTPLPPFPPPFSISLSP